MPAMMAEEITPEIDAPIAQGRMMANLLALWTSFWATLAVVGRHDTPAMPMTGLNGVRLVQ